MMEISHSNVRYVTKYSCFKMSYVNHHVALVYKENINKISCSNVNFVTTDFVESVTGKGMLQQFMNEIGCSNVKFVTTDCLEKVT